MTALLTVHGFETSNNIKVRVALGHKAIAYEFHTIEPRDRDEIVRLSGQYLTPVLVHGDRVVFDSAAILRYLDVTFPDTPKLFGHSHAEQWEIEDWELFARATLAKPMMDVVHIRVTGGEVSKALLDRCTDAFAEAMAMLAGRLQDRTWLVGDALSAADITGAAVVRRIRAAELFPSVPAVAGVERWVDAVMQFDGPSRVS